MKKLNVFIDGACKDVKHKEKAIGGWGYIITDEQFNVITQDNGKIREGLQDSNRAELGGLYQALLKMKTFKGNNKFHIYTDCEAISDSVNGYSERRANRDYWNQIEPLCRKLAGHFRISHIVSHQSNDNDNKLIEFNNKVDKLARVGANCLTKAPVRYIAI